MDFNPIININKSNYLKTLVSFIIFLSVYKRNELLEGVCNNDFTPVYGF